MNKPTSTAQACTVWCGDAQWDALRGVLAVGIANRLKSAARALYALQRLNEMLFADALGRAAARDGADYEPIPDTRRDALHIATLALGGIAVEMLEDIRDNADQLTRQRPEGTPHV